MSFYPTLVDDLREANTADVPSAVFFWNGLLSMLMNTMRVVGIFPSEWTTQSIATLDAWMDKWHGEDGSPSQTRLRGPVPDAAGVPAESHFAPVLEDGLAETKWHTTQGSLPSAPKGEPAHQGMVMAFASPEFDPASLPTGQVAGMVQPDYKTSTSSSTAYWGSSTATMSGTLVSVNVLTVSVG